MSFGSIAIRCNTKDNLQEGGWIIGKKGLFPVLRRIFTCLGNKSGNVTFNAPALFLTFEVVDQ
jgi:hypothetical protein